MAVTQMPAFPQASAWAYQYHFRVIPADREKRPLIKDWLTAASSSSRQIRLWAQEFSDCNFAAVTGRASGILVLIFEFKNGQKGRKSLRKLTQQYSFYKKGGKYLTMAVRSPSGGLHLYFKYPTGVRGIKSLSKIPDLPGVELKAERAYIMLPGGVALGGWSWRLINKLSPAPWPFPRWWELSTPGFDHSKHTTRHISLAATNSEDSGTSNVPA